MWRTSICTPVCWWRGDTELQRGTETVFSLLTLLAEKHCRSKARHGCRIPTGSPFHFIGWGILPSLRPVSKHFVANNKVTWRHLRYLLTYLWSKSPPCLFLGLLLEPAVGILLQYRKEALEWICIAPVVMGGSRLSQATRFGKSQKHLMGNKKKQFSGQIKHYRN